LPPKKTKKPKTGNQKPKQGWETASRVIEAAFRASERSPVIAASVATFPYGIVRLLDSGNSEYWSLRRQAEAMTNEIFQVANKLAEGGGPQLVTPLFSVGPGGARHPLPSPTMDLRTFDINKFVSMLMKKPST